MRAHRCWLAGLLWRLVVALGFICSARAGGAPVSSDLDVIRGKQATEGFALANVPRTFEFPRDHGPHPEFRHEWWYVTGNLDSDRGERFGFELTIFRVGLGAGAARAAGAVGAAGPAGVVGAAGAAGVAGVAGVVGVTGAAGVAGPVGAGAVSGWRTRQVYAAHFAITDVERGTFAFAEKYSRDALGLAGAQAEPFRVWLDDWVLGSPDPSVAPGDVRMGPNPTRTVESGGSALGSPWTIHARGQGYELTLDAQLLGQPVLNGDQGLSRKSAEPGAASYYYSIPRIAVHGKVVRAGVPSVVKGLAWLDREWGSGSLGATEQGWDWFALQLGDGSSLMFYALRNHDGTRDPHSAGTWVDSAGHARPLSTDQVTIDVSDHWVSPRGGRYPSRWRVRVPAVGLDVEVRPALANQELGTRPRYWEGAADLHGVQEGRDVTGRGYVELVGYGE